VIRSDNLKMLKVRCLFMR